MQRSGIHSVFGCIFISITAAAVSISQPGSAFIKSWWLVKVTVLEDKSQDEQNWWLYGERPGIIIGPVESSRVAWGQGLQYLHCLVPEHGRVNRIINTSAHRHGQAILTRANQTNRTSRHSVFSSLKIFLMVGRKDDMWALQTWWNVQICLVTEVLEYE